MLTIRRVLFPTDFSEAAARAFPQAAFLADWHDAELHIVNVTEGGEAPEHTLPVGPERLGEWLGESRTGAAPDWDALPVVQKQVSGEPAERLLAYVDDRDIDLVVMGTHGRRGVRRMLLGSVTEEVIRGAECPVLTVRTDAPEAPRTAVRRILVPVDFSEAAEMAVQHAKEIAQTYGAEIHLLHVIEEVMYPSAYGVEMPPLSSEEVVGRLERSLGNMAREDIGYEHVQISVTVGYAPLSILDYVEENEVDLLVIATHGRTGLDRVLVGSTAEALVRRSAVPVLTVSAAQRTR
jgi:nucleotide-binding universal stress UspA family protein